ncbi:transcriptional regulator [Delftia acidovorans]|uniref:S24 family peptidase n=1 Tax=Delftia acidovorans TaxID=80866 RepID=UPI001EFE0C4C|nr:S24 family peptidase [Delftia acidovorans]MCG8990796.1 transcriptional regulator [Delftia acidovorans]
MEIADIRRRNAQRSWMSSRCQLQPAASTFPPATARHAARPQVFREKIARRMEANFYPEHLPGWLDQLQDSILDGDATIVAEPAAMKSAGDIRIPQYETGGSMGHGIVLADQPGVIKQWTVSEKWLHMNVQRITSAKNLAIVTGFGPSMQPLFNPGDPLLVDRGVKLVDTDGVYFFRVGTEGFVKQLQRIPTINGLVLRARATTRCMTHSTSLMGWTSRCSPECEDLEGRRILDIHQTVLT